MENENETSVAGWQFSNIKGQICVRRGEDAGEVVPLSIAENILLLARLSDAVAVQEREEDLSHRVDTVDPVRAANNMTRHGGGFMKSLGESIIRADHQNRAKLISAFPEAVIFYGSMGD